MAKTYEAFQKRKQGDSISANEIPLLTDWNDIHLNGSREIAEIGNKLNIVRKTDGAQCFHFVSAKEGEGTTSVITNLARFLARGNSDKNVLLLDCNIRNPVLHIAFDIPKSPGLGEIIKKEIDFGGAIRRISEGKIHVLPIGDSAAAETINVEQDKVSEVLQAAKERFHYVIIDSPPILVSPIALMVATISDVTLIVVKANEAHWEVVKKAQNLLRDNRCHIAGVVLNSVRKSIPNWLYKRL